MKAPYFSKERILRNENLRAYWLNTATSMDDGSVLNRKIAELFPNIGFFVRELMKNETHADLFGCEMVKGESGIREKLEMENLHFNCKGVTVISRKKGIRINSLHFVFALPDDDFVEVEYPAMPNIPDTFRD